MFGRHKKKGREAGLAVRNSLSVASIGTPLHEIGEGFKPAPVFFLEPYVLGYCVSLLNCFRTHVLNGGGWSTVKTGEYMMAAFSEMQRDTIPNPPDALIAKITELKCDTDFCLGQEDAQRNFAAMYGMISQSYEDPVVSEARSMASSYQKIAQSIDPANRDPDAGFKQAIVELTLKKKLHTLYAEA